MVIIFVALLRVVIVDAQDSTATPYPIAPYLHIHGFPDDLYCDEIKSVSKGPSWGEITIGISSAEDLKHYIATIYDYDVTQYADFIEFTKKGKLFKEDGVPGLIDACIDVNTQIVTAIKMTINRLIHIQDLITKYSIPDAITWSSFNTSRTAFWF